MKKYYVYDIDLDFAVRPNDDIYTETYDTDMFVEVGDDVYDVEGWIEQTIREELEVEFDTPDEPYYEISGATFVYELIEDKIVHDNPADEYEPNMFDDMQLIVDDFVTAIKKVVRK
jgi:hypothetical protein